MARKNSRHRAKTETQLRTRHDAARCGKFGFGHRAVGEADPRKVVRPLERQQLDVCAERSVGICNKIVRAQARLDI